MTIRLPVTLMCAVVCAGAAGLPSRASAAARDAPGVFVSQPVLRVGSQGLLVADWQQVLNEWLRTVGASPDPRRADVLLRSRLGGRLRVDGLFGPATLAATKQWQRDSYIRADGLVTWRTWLRWIGGGVTCCGAGYPNFTRRIIGRLDPNVGWWQVALDRWLHVRQARPILITGRYDEATRSITALFQRSAGLPRTGIAAEATWLRITKVRGALTLP